MKIDILTEKFDPWQAVADYHKALLANSRCPQGVGASTVFVGFMRDFNAGEQVQSMWIEYYPEMTRKYLVELVEQISQKYPVQDVLLLHRVGQIQVSEPIVVVAVWSQHRDEAYRANREMIETLKTQAPLWKKEQLIHTSGKHAERWVTQTSQAHLNREQIDKGRKPI